MIALVALTIRGICSGRDPRFSVERKPCVLKRFATHIDGGRVLMYAGVQLAADGGGTGAPTVCTEKEPDPRRRHNSMTDDLSYYLNAFKRRFVLFLPTFLLVLACGVAAAKFWPRIYEGRAVILVESQRIPNELVRSTVTAIADERIQVIKQRVRARDNLLAIMRKYDLFANRRTKWRWSQSEIIDLMKKRTAIQRISVSPGRSRRQLPTIAFTVSFRYKEPALAARVTNDLVTFILSEDVRTRTTRASETTSFLEKESTRLANELVAKEGELKDLKTKFRDALPSKLQYSLIVLERSQKELADLDRKINEAEVRRKLIERQPRAIGDEVGGNAALSNQLRQLTILLAQKQATYTDAHPEIKRLRQQVAALESQIEQVEFDGKNDKNTPQSAGNGPAEARPESRRLASIDDQLASLRLHRAALAKSIAQLRKNIDSTPQVELVLTGLQRQYDLLQKEYKDIKAKEADAELGKKLEENKQGERFEVIEQATPPDKPIKPNRMMILAFGIFAALAAGVGVIIVAEVLDNRIHASRQLVEAFEIPPIATIPRIRTQTEVRQTGAKGLAATAGVLGAGAVILFVVDQYYKPIPLLLQNVTNIFLKAIG